jgi:hypothetical protein
MKKYTGYLILGFICFIGLVAFFRARAESGTIAVDSDTLPFKMESQPKVFVPYLMDGDCAPLKYFFSKKHFAACEKKKGICSYDMVELSDCKGHKLILTRDRYLKRQLELFKENTETGKGK